MMEEIKRRTKEILRLEAERFAVEHPNCRSVLDPEEIADPVNRAKYSVINVTDYSAWEHKPIGDGWHLWASVDGKVWIRVNEGANLKSSPFNVVKWVPKLQNMPRVGEPSQDYGRNLAREKYRKKWGTVAGFRWPSDAVSKIKEGDRVRLLSTPERSTTSVGLVRQVWRVSVNDLPLGVPPHVHLTTGIHWPLDAVELVDAKPDGPLVIIVSPEQMKRWSTTAATVRLNCEFALIGSCGEEGPEWYASTAPDGNLYGESQRTWPDTRFIATTNGYHPLLEGDHVVTIGDGGGAAASIAGHNGQYVTLRWDLFGLSGLWTVHNLARVTDDQPFRKEE